MILIALILLGWFAFHYHSKGAKLAFWLLLIGFVVLVYLTIQQSTSEESSYEGYLASSSGSINDSIP